MSCYCGRTWNAHILVSIFFIEICVSPQCHTQKQDVLLRARFPVRRVVFVSVFAGSVWSCSFWGWVQYGQVCFRCCTLNLFFLDSVLHCSDALSSWKVATYSAGGRSVGRLYPPGFAGRCSFDLCVSCQQALLRGASGPVFRGAALLDFCVKHQGDRPTFVWEHVAKNPRVLGLRLFVLSIGCSRGASCASRSFLRQWGVGRLFVFSCGFCTFGCFRVEKCRWRRRFGL